MTKEEKAKYQKFATFCMREEITVLFRGHKYRVENLLYGIEKQSKKEYINAILADLNGCNSLITAGLEELYEENNREDNDNDTV
jgi:hypothetical protein